MTKQELIEKLRDFPDDAPLFVWNPWSVDFDSVTALDTDLDGNPVIVAKE